MRCKTMFRIKADSGFWLLHSEEEVFQTAMDLDVAGYVLKDDATIDIVVAVKSVAGGKHFISSSLSSLLLNRRRRAEDLKTGKSEISSLTPTEHRVLQLIAKTKPAAKSATSFSSVTARLTRTASTSAANSICTAISRSLKTTAGSAIPVNFFLSGNKGLGVIL